MNSSVWAVWAAQGSKEKKVDLSFSERLLSVFFSKKDRTNHLRFFLPTKSWKNHPQKLLRKTQIHFFFLTASSAQMAQTEEFMFQNVAFRPTVYRTGLLGINSNIIHKKSCLQECAKKWVAITAGTLLFCYYFKVRLF